MARNDYHFITRWRLRATLAEVVEIMGDAAGLARWWPSVYLSVQELAPGDDRGIGKRFDLHTKGWLPYTLRWQLEVVALDDHTLTIKATGDFTGRGIWTALQDGPFVIMTYDWKIRANKPLLRYLSALLKPIFALNHGWAMAQGEHSLQREIERRRTGAAAMMQQPKAAPISVWVVGLVIGAVSTYLLRRIWSAASDFVAFHEIEGTALR